MGKWWIGLLLLIAVGALLWYAQPRTGEPPPEKCVLEAPFSCDATLTEEGVTVRVVNAGPAVEGAELTLGEGCFAQEPLGAIPANGAATVTTCTNQILDDRFRATMRLAYAQDGIEKGVDGGMVLRKVER